MKLSDYLAQFLVEQKVKHVFLVTGGAAAHIVDSLGRNPKIAYICPQHEQSAAMAADAYSRITKNIGVAVATSGPGATNLITGICCAWFDSIPILCITGQVNTHEMAGPKRKVRQYGFQETDVVGIVRPITKFAELVTDPKEIRYVLEKAVYLAKSGRPGPVLVDLPLNVQHADINPKTLRRFNPRELHEPKPNAAKLRTQVRRMIHMLGKAKRPVILAGGGIRLAYARPEFRKLMAKLRVPVVASWSGIDALAHSHPMYVGQLGVYGARGANFTAQNTDLIIAIGSRLDSRQTGGQHHTFAREAKRVGVDIDPGEIFKQDGVKAHLAIVSDAKLFLEEFLRQLPRVKLQDLPVWHARCRNWKKRYPAVWPEWYHQKGSVNSYVFVEALARAAGNDDIAIVDEGGNLTWTMQAWHVKPGQMLFSALGNSPMGYAFPAAIGAWFAAPQRRIICIDGDGGFQVNIQELQTVAYHKIPLKIFILNNRVYGILKQFQETYFKARYEASTPEHGYSCPDFVNIAKAYGIKAVRITNHRNLAANIRKVLATPGPVLCDVNISRDQKLIPKLIAYQNKQGRYISNPIEDQLPFLPRKEFLENMIVPPVQQEGTKKTNEIN
ncbi:thiamine pyrophosphate-binding protein [Candidatus Parcubacteria bacterium]|nr:thiamine pyrophosphate-binding protein [Candidatus Parcubacteria bacterium]